MLFNSFVFLGAFLPITYLVFWSLSSARGRYIWLALTGYVFYGFWDPRFCLLMAFSTLVSYSAGRVLLDYRDPTTRKLALVIPVTVDLMLLGFFKYANFAFDTLAGFASVTGIHATFPHLNVILKTTPTSSPAPAVWTLGSRLDERNAPSWDLGRRHEPVAEIVPNRPARPSRRCENRPRAPLRATGHRVVAWTVAVRRRGGQCREAAPRGRLRDQYLF